MFGITIRALIMEYMDLHDPTEARYASIAQEMYLSGDWLTPKLPMPHGVEPYLGKPPLHFWLTAICYSLLGVDEWQSRLPSIIAAISLLIATYFFAKHLYGVDSAKASALILLSAPLFYFIAGACVIDMTLTAFVTLGVIFFYIFIKNPKKHIAFCYASAVFASLAFLTKGPIGLVLIGLPFLLWSSIRRDFYWLKLVPWIYSGGLFLLISAPWFLLNERINSGSLEYFFFNENFGRFLLKNYGDRYGSGHQHFFGMSWLMLAGAFAPWSAVLVFVLYKTGLKRSWEWLKENEEIFFIFCWSVSAALFFTFARQLHILYILPSLPPLAILTAKILAPLLVREREPVSIRVVFIMFICWLGVLVTALVQYFSVSTLLFGLTVLIIGTLFFHTVLKYSSGVNIVSCWAVPLVTTYFLVIISFSPYIDRSYSTEDVLEVILQHSRISEDNYRIGVITRNTFSYYWTAKAWQSELSHEVFIEYIQPEKILESTVSFLMIPKKEVHLITPALLKIFKRELQIGNWIVLKRKKRLKKHELRKI